MHSFTAIRGPWAAALVGIAQCVTKPMTNVLLLMLLLHSPCPMHRLQVNVQTAAGTGMGAEVMAAFLAQPEQVGARRGGAPLMCSGH